MQTHSAGKQAQRRPSVVPQRPCHWLIDCVCGSQFAQNLGPHYRAAAATLADMDLPEPVVLAKVDDGNEDNRQRLRAGCVRKPASQPARKTR